MSIPSKALNLDENGAARVSLAANTDIATTYVEVTNLPAKKLPETPLENRRSVVIAFPTDSVFLGPSGIDNDTGYATRGRGAGTGWTGKSQRSAYSTRTQFLRGQYLTLRVSDELDVYGVNDKAIEEAAVLELS